MGNHRFGQCGIGGRGAHLHKGVHPLGYISHRNRAVRFGGLGADDLAVLDNVEHRVGEGVAAVVQLDKFYLYLGVILKYQGHIGLAVPAERLLDLAGFRAFGIALRGRDLGGGVAADGHILPGNVGQIAASASDVSAGKVVVHADDLNNRPGKALGGIVRVHFADAALAGDFRGVGKGDGYGGVAAVGEDNVLRPSVVDLVALRGLQFGHGVGARVQSGQSIGSVAACYDLLGVGAILGSNLKSRSGQALVGVGAVHLLDGEIILLPGDVQFTNHNGLHVADRMILGAGASVGVFVDAALAPYALCAQIQNILGAVTERFIAHYIVDAGIAGMLQIVVDAQQFLGAGSHRVRQQTGLVAPDDGLYPGVHRPGIAAVPHVVHAQGLVLIGKDAGGMCVEVSHHGGHGGVGNGLGIAPCVALQRPAHAFPLFGAEAHGTLSAQAKVHLVQVAGAQGRRFIFDAVVGTVVHLDGAGTCRQSRGGQQAQHTHQHKQHSRHAGEGETDFLHKVKLLSVFEHKKRPSSLGLKDLSRFVFHYS